MAERIEDVVPEEIRRSAGPTLSFAAFMASLPLADIDLERERDCGRDAVAENSGEECAIDGD
ncbi:hypothetical protein [Rhizobium sp. SG2393]|uniref:hypothetical protein n=1 Tax=Rhizobium sp. SG2393 TaxID=3276279 RepID=UPI00366F1910